MIDDVKKETSTSFAAGNCGNNISSNEISSNEDHKYKFAKHGNSRAMRVDKQTGHVDEDIRGSVTVDSREKVVVEKDSDKNCSRIVFENGKVWNCIDQDMINCYDGGMDDWFSKRFYDNIYENNVIDDRTTDVCQGTPIKDYTDEEIELIYTMDPHGLAAYVKEYADCLSRNGDGVQDILRRALQYKDKIFSMLFNREPQYYRRDLQGNCCETAYKPDLREVLSESEFLFGQHAIYDIVTRGEFITVAIHIFSMIIQCPALKSIGVFLGISKVIEYYSLLHCVAKPVIEGDFNAFISAIANKLVDDGKPNQLFISPSNYKTKNYTLCWATDLLSFSSDLGVLANTFGVGPHFYKEIFTKCENNPNYNILIRTTDNKLISISDINHAIN